MDEVFFQRFRRIDLIERSNKLMKYMKTTSNQEITQVMKGKFNKFVFIFLSVFPHLDHVLRYNLT